MLLAACADGPATRPAAPAPVLAGAAGAPECGAFVRAWVGHFKGHVKYLRESGHISQTVAPPSPELEQTRAQLLLAGIDEQDCQRPLCIIRPTRGGSFDSYCGYRQDTPDGDAIYRWIPYK